MRCTYDGCRNRAAAKGLCHGHYQQLRRGRPLAPLKRARAAYYAGLRVIRWQREYHPAVEAAAADRQGCAEYRRIDWLVTRARRGIEGPLVARTISVDREVYCYWCEGYLAYAPSEEFSEVMQLVASAILAEYPHLEALEWEASTVAERLAAPAAA